MTRSERASQIWPLLAHCASCRQTLGYERLASLIGVPRVGLGQLLEPIQSFCIVNRLPPLTVLVVSDTTGSPGEGFVAAQDVPRAQAEVFAHAWQAAPSPDVFEAAVKQVPSNGRPLQELRSQFGSGS
jgi:hypothetical protein